MQADHSSLLTQGCGDRSGYSVRVIVTDRCLVEMVAIFHGPTCHCRQPQLSWCLCSSHAVQGHFARVQTHPHAHFHTAGTRMSYTFWSSRLEKKGEIEIEGKGGNYCWVVPPWLECKLSIFPLWKPFAFLDFMLEMFCFFCACVCIQTSGAVSIC